MHFFATIAACIAIPLVAQPTIIQPPTTAPATETRSFALQNGGRLKISGNVGNGNINISGWDKNEVALTANFKAKSDRKHIRIEVDSKSDSLELVAKSEGREGIHFIYIPAACELELKVPRRTACNITAECRTIFLKDLAGEHVAKTTYGNINLKNISGSINASSYLGSIKGDLPNVENDLIVSATHGNINIESLHVGGNAKISSHNGKIRGDFQNIQNNLDIKTTSSKIDINLLKIGGKINMTSRLGSIHGKLPAATNDFVILTTKGDINVKLLSPDGILNATTDYRKIKVGSPLAKEIDVTRRQYPGYSKQRIQFFGIGSTYKPKKYTGYNATAKFGNGLAKMEFSSRHGSITIR
jgi:hypothetical protein